MARRSVEWKGRCEANRAFGFGDPAAVSIVDAAFFEVYTNPTIIRLEGCLNFQLDRVLDRMHTLPNR